MEALFQSHVPAVMLVVMDVKVVFLMSSMTYPAWVMAAAWFWLDWFKSRILQNKERSPDKAMARMAVASNISGSVKAFFE